MTSTRFAIFFVLALSACDVGTFGAGGGGGDDIDVTMCGNRESATSTPPMPVFHTHTAPVVTGNPSNQGQGCVAANCHLGGQLGPAANEEQFAGTLYADAAQTMPQAGAHIRIKDSTDNKVVEAITDMYGNFFFPAGSLANPFPSQTSAAVCPTAGGGSGVSAMVAPIATGGGNCNQGMACHGTPLGVTPGTTALYLISQ